MDLQRRYMECGMYGKTISPMILVQQVLKLVSQIWDIFESESLFTGHDPELRTYRSRAHLAEMISLLGPPPLSLLAQGKLSHKFFSDEGKPPFVSGEFQCPLTMSDFLGDFCTEISSQDRIPLEERETTLEGQDKASFLRLIRKMLQWEPGKRSSAKELQEDEWIRKHL
jgi:serine/threonine-protein kinase SRPK3